MREGLPFFIEFGLKFSNLKEGSGIPLSGNCPQVEAIQFIAPNFLPFLLTPCP
jgi:hypothetical protein